MSEEVIMYTNISLQLEETDPAYGITTGTNASVPSGKQHNLLKLLRRIGFTSHKKKFARKVIHGTTKTQKVSARSHIYIDSPIVECTRVSSVQSDRSDR
ncbi:MAG TPA: hypothetical protein VIH27_03815 [Nitrososphaerales archaeon]